MACGKPSFAANEGFRDILGRWRERLLFRHGDAEDLARKVAGLLDLDETERQIMGRELRQSVLTHHSLERLMRRLLSVFEAVQL